MSETVQKRKITVRLILTWLFLFPIMLTVLLWKNVDWPLNKKIPAFLFGWIFILVFIGIIQKANNLTIESVDSNQIKIELPGNVEQAPNPTSEVLPSPTETPIQLSQEDALDKIQSYKLTQQWYSFEPGTTVKKAVEDNDKDKGTWNLQPSNHENAFVIEYVSGSSQFRPKWTVQASKIIALNGSARRVTPEFEAQIETNEQDESQQIYQEVRAHMDALYKSKDYVSIEEEDAAFSAICKKLGAKYKYTEREIAEIYTKTSLENMRKFQEQNKDL